MALYGQLRGSGVCSRVVVVFQSALLVMAMAGAAMAQPAGADDEENARLEAQIKALAAQCEYAMERLDFDATLELYDEILDLKVKRFGEKSSQVADMRLGITDVKLEQSLAQSNRIGLMEIYRLHGYAKDASAKNDLERLLSIAKMQVAKADELFGTKHSGAIRARQWQCEALIRLGRLEETLPVLREQLALSDELFPTAHPDRIETLGLLATVERAFGSKSAAQTYLREAVELLEQTDRVRLMTIYQIRDEQAKYDHAAGKWDQAADQHRAIIQACEKRGSDAAGFRVIAFADLAELEMARNRYSNAYFNGQEAHRHLNPAVGAASMSAALGSDIALFSTIGETEKAEAAIEELGVIASERIDGVEGPHVEHALCAAGLHWIQCKKFDKAVKTYRNVSALPTYKSAEAFRGVGWALTEAGELAKAERALADIDLEGDENEFLYERAVREFNALVLANLRYRQGRKDEAVKLLEKNLTAAYQFYGEDNPILLPYVQLRVDVLRGCGNEAEAKSLEAKVTRLKERQTAARKEIDELARKLR
jgi:hypothetical protein